MVVYVDRLRKIPETMWCGACRVCHLTADMPDELDSSAATWVQAGMAAVVSQRHPALRSHASQASTGREAGSEGEVA
jgi:hypothetical protein